MHSTFRSRMARPRVPDEKRQRTARACDCCKRRKQKVSVTSYQSFFFIQFEHPETWAPHSFLYTPRHAHTSKKEQRDFCFAALFALLPILTFQFPTIECRDMHVTPNMCFASRSTGSSCEKSQNSLLQLQRTIPSEAKRMRVSGGFFSPIAQHMYSSYMSVQYDTSSTWNAGLEASARL